MVKVWHCGFRLDPEFSVYMFMLSRSMQFCPVICTCIVQFWAENYALLITGLCAFVWQTWNRKDCSVRPATLIVSACCVTVLTAPRMNSAYTSSQSMTVPPCSSHSLERCRNHCLLRNTVPRTDKWQVCQTVMCCVFLSALCTVRAQMLILNSCNHSLWRLLWHLWQSISGGLVWWRFDVVVACWFLS